MKETTNGQLTRELPLAPSRRRLMGWLVAVINLIVAGTVIGPVLGFVGSPLGRKRSQRWVPVLDEADLPVGATREASFLVSVKDGYATVERRYTVYLRRFPDRVVAFEPSCTHLGCRVRFRESKQRYFCPCHGGVFDNEGNVISGPPPRPLETHPTKIENGRIWVLKDT